MNRTVKAFILSLAVIATTLTTMPLANAGSRWDGRRDYHRHRGGEALAAGIAGLAVGAIIAGASKPRYVDPYYGGGYYAPAPRRHVRYYRDYEPRYYRPAPPRYYQPAPRHYRGLEPWSREWFRYCESRYRSFDPRSGTFVTYGGERRFCVAN